MSAPPARPAADAASLLPLARPLLVEAALQVPLKDLLLKPAKAPV
jgi:hypothetical protein